MKLPAAKEKKVFLALLFLSSVLYLFSFTILLLVNSRSGFEVSGVLRFVFSPFSLFLLIYMTLGLIFLKAHNFIIKIFLFGLAFSLIAIAIFASGWFCFPVCPDNSVLIFGSLYMGFVLYLTIFIWTIFKKFHLRYIFIVLLIIFYLVIMYQFIYFAIPTPIGPWYIGGRI